MQFKALNEFIFSRCKESNKGNGFYIEVVDVDYNKYTFYSRKKFDLEKGQKVVPILDVYSFAGTIRFRIEDLEVV